MPNCPHCNAEVDVGQKICAWCGEEVSAAPKAKTPAPAPAPPKPPTVAFPAPSAPVAERPSHGPSAAAARELAKRGDLEGALRLYREILSIDPNDSEALFGTGGIHFKRAEHKKAIESWLKLKVLNPSYPNLDQWVANAKKNLATSGPSSPPPPSPAQRPKAPTPLPSPQGPVEDWQRQSVRVDHIDEEVLKEPLPTPKSKARKTQPEPVEEAEDFPNGAPPAWVAKAGWGLAILYIVMIWGIYFF